MELQKKKCSLFEHKDTDAKIVCVECNIYMCNKCETFHAKLFPNHQIFNSETDINDIFTGFCKEKGHFSQLEFFCKTHNQLCCGLCIARIQKKEIGKHKECNICTIEEIKDEKKNKIEENIKYLKELSNSLQKTIEELKNVFGNINENKEEVKLEIQNIFTKIRNELNQREDELLLEVDKRFDLIYYNENIIKDYEKLPEKIKILLDKAENINKDEKDNKLSLFINVCINIENNIKNIMEMNENIKKCKNSINNKMEFIPEGKETFEQFLNTIKEFGQIESEFIEINNPWTTEKYHNNVFYYTLKENNYVAVKQKDNSYIHCIKSSYEFKKDKVYKLEFIVDYKGGDFDIGFADFSSTKYINSKLSVSINFF